MTTSKPTNQRHYQQTLFVEDFPAKTSVELEKKRALLKKQDQDCSMNSCESYAWYDQDSSSWKTWQRSLTTEWTSYSESYSQQGLMRNGQLFQQQWLELVIPEIDGGLLPTPTATDFKGRSGQGYIDRHGPHRIADVLTKVGDSMSVNPSFIEEMMAYEIGYTEVKH